MADLDLASIDEKQLDTFSEDTAKILKEQRRKGPRSVCPMESYFLRGLTTTFQGTVIFMALDLLHSQVRHLNDEKVARKRGKPGPPTLSTERNASHDLEGLLWVLVHAIMIHNYNSLANETDRKEYKVTLDDYFGHGSARTTYVKRHAMLSFAYSDIGRDHISEWFSDPDERKFFISCMSLIAEHYRPEKTVVNWKTPMSDLNDDSAPWGHTDDESDNSLSPDEDAEDTSGTYRSVKATKSAQVLVAASTRPPVITYESVISLLINSVNELK